MTNFMSMFFGPLDKSSCVYFFILTIIFFVGLLILIFNEMIYILQNLNKLNMRMLSSGVIIIFNIFVAYFVNRLLYTMCSKSLA
jgi:hypothetical protein